MSYLKRDMRKGTPHAKVHKLLRRSHLGRVKELDTPTCSPQDAKVKVGVSALRVLGVGGTDGK